MLKEKNYKYMIITQNIDGSGHRQMFKTGTNVEKYFAEREYNINNNPLARIIIYKRGTKYWNWLREKSMSCGGNKELIKIHEDLSNLFSTTFSDDKRLKLTDIDRDEYQHLSVGITE